MISTAWAADAHGGGGLLSDPTFWVAVAFVIFLAIAGKTLTRGIIKQLDDRTALIARTLGEAEKLRTEAHKARDDAQKSLADSAKLAQEIIAKNHFRPLNQEVAAKYASSFKKIPLVTIDDTFGGWKKAQATHFADGGVFDQIYKPG